ncbi:hypothetical protein [Mycobacterium lepromatosis]|uniref:hypothetical protein n=1 Tax=Mycobacterium lepromatosis TaxID=480418 RepID=UPI000AD21296|nr:hypothetical protein [Mycobacterium lepromatosis]
MAALRERILLLLAGPLVVKDFHGLLERIDRSYVAIRASETAAVIGTAFDVLS